MDPFPGVDLSKAIKASDEAVVKVASQRVTAYLIGLRMQAHNLRRKAFRLHNEADVAAFAATEVEAKLVAVVAGDWSGIEPFELAAGQGSTDQKINKE